MRVQAVAEFCTARFTFDCETRAEAIQTQKGSWLTWTFLLPAGREEAKTSSPSPPPHPTSKATHHHRSCADSLASDNTPTLAVCKQTLLLRLRQQPSGACSPIEHQPSGAGSWKSARLRKNRWPLDPFLRLFLSSICFLSVGLGTQTAVSCHKRERKKDLWERKERWNSLIMGGVSGKWVDANTKHFDSGAEGGELL